MELQQRFSVCINEYEEGEGEGQGQGDTENRETQKNDAVVKTEDIYQSLQYPPADQGTINCTPLFSGKTTEDGWMEFMDGWNSSKMFMKFTISVSVLITINLCLTEFSERKYVFLLFAVNILISTIILTIVGLNCKFHDTAF